MNNQEYLKLSANIYMKMLFSINNKNIQNIYYFDLFIDM